MTRLITLMLIENDHTSLKVVLNSNNQLTFFKESDSDDGYYFTLSYDDWIELKEFGDAKFKELEDANNDTKTTI